MPNVNISVYLAEEEYLKYVKKKATINEKVREIVKSEVKLDGN